MNNNFPRVLILGHQFDDKTGLGVTLSNLFYDWPKDDICVMGLSLRKELCERVRPYSNYIGNNEAKKETWKELKINSMFQRLRTRIRRFYYYIGLNEIRYVFPYKEYDVRRAKAFNPDILFCCLGSLNSMRTCLRMKEELPYSKLVLYIVDDWVNTKESNRLFRFYWRNQNEHSFKVLLDKATLLLSICDYMSKEYMQKYGKVFIPFHNPVDVNYWVGIKSVPMYSENIISLLYVGKINDDTRECLKKVALSIKKLNSTVKRYVFDVYTPDYNTYCNLFSYCPDCHIFKPVPHHDIPILTKSYSALLLTLGFSKKTREYVRLSMPTKLSEYLASGIPIILNCPSDIALAKYLLPLNCTIPCLTDEPNSLSNAIKKLEDKNYCDKIVESASKEVIKHDVTIVRSKFLSVMNNCI